MQTDPQPDSSSNNVMRPILETYYLGGTDAVRAFLHTNTISNEKIEMIVAQLQQDFPDLPIKGTMPWDGLQSFINNIYVARTSHSGDGIDSMYQSMKEDARWARERRYLMRAAFFEALAAIVKDEPVTLADDNPFKPHVVALIGALNAWKSQRRDDADESRGSVWICEWRMLRF